MGEWQNVFWNFRQSTMKVQAILNLTDCPTWAKVGFLQHIQYRDLGCFSDDGFCWEGWQFDQWFLLEDHILILLSTFISGFPSCVYVSLVFTVLFLPQCSLIDITETSMNSSIYSEINLDIERLCLISWSLKAICWTGLKLKMSQKRRYEGNASHTVDLYFKKYA